MSDRFQRAMLVATKLSLRDLDRVVATAPKRYKVYNIAKRDGGSRTIAHPSRELKILQRLILKDYLLDLPIHVSAAAYVAGRGIKDNAQQHVRCKFLLKMDFQDFFPSIRVSDWRSYVNRSACKLKLDMDDQRAFEKILFWGIGSDNPLCLSIGAPTSPAISNIIMFKFDSKVTSQMRYLDINYTRYADDLTFSSNNLSHLQEIEKRVEDIVRLQRWPKLKLKQEKRGLYTNGVRQMVTGLVLTPQGNISIGRSRKRLIRAMVNNHVNYGLSDEDLKRLQGLLGFALGCEPSFVESLRRKFGHLTIRKIQQHR